MTGVPGAGTTLTTDQVNFLKLRLKLLHLKALQSRFQGLRLLSADCVPGGTFKMGSTNKEPFHKEDESPVRNGTVSPFLWLK